MKILKQIHVSEIKTILDDYFEKLKRGEVKYANVAFLSPEAFGKNRNIEEWLEFHKDCVQTYENIYPALQSVEKDGILVADNKGPYVFYDCDLEQLAKEQQPVLYYRRLNYGRDFNADPELNKLLTNRKYKNPIANAHKYDLSNVRLAIATVFPKGIHVNTDETLLESFDIYEVTAAFKDTIDFLTKEREKEIGILQAKIAEVPQKETVFRRLLAEKIAEKAVLEQIAERNVNIRHSAVFPPIYVEYALSNNEGSFSRKLAERLEDDKAIFGGVHNLEEIYKELEKIGDL